MKKTGFDTWIQLLGLLSVLGGLIFVGLELQQSHRIAIASQVQARNDSIMQYLMAPLEGNTAALKFYNFSAFMEIDTSLLNNEDRLIYDQLSRFRLISLQNAFQQYTLGMIPDDVFEFTRRTSLTMYDNCLSRRMFEDRAAQDFLTYLKENSATVC